MADDKYLIPTQPEPEQNEKRPHPWTLRTSVAALTIAVIAALFAGWQAYEAHKARLDAEMFSDAQAKDVERSRRAAENSATAANKLADVGQKSLTLIERGARAAEHSSQTAEEILKANIATFKFNERPLLSLTEYKTAITQEGKHIEFMLTIGNNGKTEAIAVTRELAVYYNRILITQARPLGQDLLLPITPYMHMTYAIAVDLTAAQATSVASGVGVLTAILNIQFKNAFSDAQPDAVWCLEYNPLRPDNWTPCKPF